MRKNKYSILSAIFLIIFIGSLSYIIYDKYQSKIENQRIEELKQELENPQVLDIVEEQHDMNTEELETQVQETEILETESNEEKIVLSKYQSLYEENSDMIGWITIDDTVIDYPVMQTFDDPTFYINKDWDKNESKQGLPLIDARCTLESENIIIYSHNMKNGTMFTDLKYYVDEEYFKQHQIVKFDTIYEEAKYQVIAVLLAKVYYDEEPPENEFLYYNYIELDSEEQFDYYVENVKKLSLYDTGQTAEYGDSLITLCTCYYHVKDGRILVVAKKIQ